jgi:hypothetical protein
VLGLQGTANKAISLALLVGVALLAALVGALLAALAPAAWKLTRQPAQDKSGAVPYVVTSWKPAPERAQHVKSGAVPSVVEEANAGRAIESAGPPADSQGAPPAATTIPSRPIRELAKGTPRSYRDREPLRLVRDLQGELKRVGCYSLDIDGEWTPATRRAMKDFTERVKSVLPVERPDPDHLLLLQSHSEPVCRDSCRAGEGNADHRCLASSLLGSESRKSAATPLQLVFTKSYVTPSNPEPEAADVAALPEDAPRRAEAPPRPRRHSTRPSGVSSLLFGIFSW